MMKKKQIRRGCVTLALLISAFFLTSFYLASEEITVKTVGGNIFATETMKIGIVGNTNDGGKIVFENVNADSTGRNIVEPGMTMRGSFTVQNMSTFEVYYRLRFEFKDDCGLADVLKVTISANKDGSDPLCKDVTMSELANADCFRTEYQKLHGSDSKLPKLAAGTGTDTLYLIIKFPEGTGNAAQGLKLENCELHADMTQVKNQNPNNIDFSLSNTNP